MTTNKLAVVCVQCGNQFYVFPSQALTRRYCSRACSYAAQQNRVTVECEWCGKPFEIRDSKRSYGGGKYCSVECKYNGLRNPVVDRICEYCGNVFQIREYDAKRSAARFCSRECSTFGQRNRIVFNCIVCGEIFDRTPSVVAVVTPRFCSNECAGAWRSTAFLGENNQNWKGGLSRTRYYGPNWHEQQKLARTRDRHTCQSCGVTEEELGRTLDVHHLKPFRSFNYVPSENDNFLLANDLDNLISLCQRCHGLLEDRSKKW